ncbi:MAG: methyltransferase family protein [Herminiimonas sp.]|nr:methyltransferase family protein [Herminiimonas sp.]
MDESSKSKEFFSPFELSLFKGKVLDIGAGKDPVIPDAVAFDLADGDANEIKKFAPESFDCVYSSHCLEHMWNPGLTLKNWWSLVKPGGYLFLIVPDEDLYEQGSFPSTFNPDHKHTFTIGKKKSWSPNSINVFDLCKSLENGSIENIALNDISYNRNLAFYGKKAKGWWMTRLKKLYTSLRKRNICRQSAYFEKLFARTIGWDQSGGLALAQIEVVVRKS